MKTFDESDVARELLLEWRDPYLNVVYRRGGLYTALRLCHSLTAGLRADPFRGPFSGQQLGVAYFLNDYRTLEEYRGRAPDLRVEYINGPRLGFVTRARGIAWILRTLIQGWRALRASEPQSNGRSRAMPLLGWILYRHLTELNGHTIDPSRYVIANIAHPLLLGAALAFARRGIPVDFVEHAMTPRILMRPLPLTNVYALSAHTLHGWRAAIGVSDMLLHCIGDAEALRPQRYRLPMEPRVLICANPLDTLDGIHAALRAVATAGGRATVRLHDADARVSAIGALAKSMKGQLSLASKSPVSSDLNHADLVICGNSNVLIDALRHERRVVYFWPGDQSRFDYYGCVAHYDVDAARSEEELCAVIAAMTAGRAESPIATSPQSR